MTMLPGSPSMQLGQPSGDGVAAAALTGPPLTALTGRGVGGAPALPTAHRWPPAGGRMGQSKEPKA
jgi:hypothetical protein